MDKDIKQFSERVSYLMPQIAREVFKKELKHIGPAEITFSQMVILELLRQRGSCKMKDVAENFSITRSAATGLVDRMVKAQLLERQAHPKDRRIIGIKITQKGKSIIDRFSKKRTNLMIKTFGKLKHKERDAYLGILEKIYAILKREKK